MSACGYSLHSTSSMGLTYHPDVGMTVVHFVVEVGEFPERDMLTLAISKRDPQKDNQNMTRSKLNTSLQDLEDYLSSYDGR